VTQFGEAHLVLERRTGLQLFDRFQHAPQSEVVGDPPIDNVQVGTVRAVLQRLEIAIAQQRSSGRARHVFLVRDVLNPDGQQRYTSRRSCDR
jgi:hypothetical protein